MEKFKFKIWVFSSRKQDLLKYFSIFYLLLSSSFFLSSSNFDQILPICHIYIYATIIDYFSDYFWLFFFDFFRFFPIFSDFFRFFQKKISDIFNFFLHFFQHFSTFSTFFTIQSFFTTIFTRALDLHLSLVLLKPCLFLIAWFRADVDPTNFFLWKSTIYHSIKPPFDSEVAEKKS